MNKRLAGVLAFAFIISAGASLLLYRFITAKLAAQPEAASATLIVAARDLQIGTVVKELDVKSVDWKGELPPHAINKTEDIIGRGVMATIYTGEPIVETRLAAKGAGGGLAATIPIGMRAVAVRVDDVMGVAGFVTPGMRVDVLIMGTPPTGSNAGTVSKTLLQNIEVLSAGQQIQRDNEGKPIPVPVVNLLATPEQAEILSLASNHARIQLVLRNPLDKDQAKTAGAALGPLFSGQTAAPHPATTKPVARRPAAPPPPRPPEVKAPAPPPPLVVEVIHGAAKTQTAFKKQAEGIQ